MENIIKNAIQCNYCKKVITSAFRHDFRLHACEGLIAVRGPEYYIAVDGGTAYLKRIGNKADWTDVSEFRSVPDDYDKHVNYNA